MIPMNTVIRVENISKSYRLGSQPNQYKTVGQFITSGFSSFYQKMLSHNSRKDNSQDSDVFWALKHINFEVRQGDKIGIIGKNGAGKSTLLKILSRITTPTKGRVTLYGHVASLLEVGTGFHPELTGRENIYLNGAILGMTKNDIKRRFDEIVSFSEIETFLDTPVKRYSSGMFVRLAFAVAAHLEPDILIVDEVLAVGDASFQKKCIGKIDKIGKSGRTVLFVSHNMVTVQDLCDSCLLIENGQLKSSGESSIVISEYMNGNNDASDLNSTQIFSIDEKQLLNCCMEGFKISNIVLSNETSPGLPISSGDKIQLKIYYEAARKFIAPAFVVKFKNYNNFEIFRLSNVPISGHPIEKLFEKGCIELTVDSLPFTKGRYSIDIGFMREFTEWYFNGENIVSFQVLGRDIYKSGHELDQSRGVIFIDHQWYNKKVDLEDD